MAGTKWKEAVPSSHRSGKNYLVLLEFHRGGDGGLAVAYQCGDESGNIQLPPDKLTKISEGVKFTLHLKGDHYWGGVCYSFFASEPYQIQGLRNANVRGGNLGWLVETRLVRIL